MQLTDYENKAGEVLVDAGKNLHADMSYRFSVSRKKCLKPSDYDTVQ